ncbi:MAG: hypothetical protein PWQ37_2885 [Candidatus Petromonas sp.]|jgi:hypothetical protein|nr:hypothetical protein [Candidatus Petromonas sp.]
MKFFLYKHVTKSYKTTKQQPNIIFQSNTLNEKKHKDASTTNASNKGDKCSLRHRFTK